jgi:protein-disulfide isomerase
MTEKTTRNAPLLILLIIAGMSIGAIITYTITQVSSQNSNAALSGVSSKDRKATEAIVRAYILENPEIITEAITVLQSREMAIRLEKIGPALFAPFAGDVAGNPSGDVTVVEFTDYNCGYCRTTVADLTKLVGTDKKVKLVYRQMPILAPSSREAASWALAAANQGKHDAFHQAMFAAGRPDTATIRNAAVSAGLDLAAAEKFAGTAAVSAELDGNIQMAQKIGFNGTPTFIIGKQVLEGAQGYPLLKSAVDKARKDGA